MVLIETLGSDSLQKFQEEFMKLFPKGFFGFFFHRLGLEDKKLFATCSNTVVPPEIVSLPDLYEEIGAHQSSSSWIIS